MAAVAPRLRILRLKNIFDKIEKQMDFAKELNPRQYDAVVASEGPLMVYAGAGTGKTRVITYRIARLILEKRVPPHRILAITFTNKAAGEMRSRVVSLVGAADGKNGGQRPASPWISTFHSFCARLLKSDAVSFGVRPEFVIYDEDDQRRTLRDVLKELRLAEDKTYRPSALVEKISRLKDSLIDADSFALNSIGSNDVHRRIFAEIYSAYAKKLGLSAALDFGDLILKVVEKFREDPAVLSKYQNRFDYVLVDEYQDTNLAQYFLTKYISASHSNVCVVGDDDQMIYSWRGADRKNMANFRADYPGAKIVKLEQNYRSTPQILSAAVSVVSNNLDRHPKTLWTDVPSGEEVVYDEFESDIHEAQAVASRIRNLSVDCATPLEKIAVLYRTNSQSRAIEDALIAEAIPYKIVGGVKFYERQEVKNLISYLKVVHNPDDEIALKRVVNVPSRGIGNATMDKLVKYAREHNLTLFQTMRIADTVGGISVRAATRVRDFSAMVARWQSEAGKISVSELAKKIAEESGYIRDLEEDKTPENVHRADNVKELVSAIAEYEDIAENPALAGYLDDISLAGDADYAADSVSGVVLTTVHLAKGLEFAAVFLIGMEESVFPLASSYADEADLEEERRLCYVAVTRARHRLFISASRYKIIYGKSAYLRPSRFVEEAFRSSQKSIGGSFSENSSLSEPSSSREAALQPSPSSEDAPPGWKIGGRVRHKSFGDGMITALSRVEEDIKVTVKFDDGKTRKFYAAFASLESVE